MAGKHKSISSDELQAAQDEARRRCDVRDQRAAKLALHKERVRPYCEGIGAALRELDKVFPRHADGRPDPRNQRASEHLAAALRDIKPPKPERTEREQRSDLAIWRAAPAREAQPGESLEVVAARVLVERGHTRFAALRAVTGLTSDDARDSSLLKPINSAVRRQITASAPLSELPPDKGAELGRVISESPRRSRRSRPPRRLR